MVDQELESAWTQETLFPAPYAMMERHSEGKKTGLRYREG